MARLTTKILPSVLLALALTSRASAQHGQNGQYGSGSGSGSGSSSSSSSSYTIPFDGNYTLASHLMLAHGLLAGIAMVLLFPLGSILLRICSFRGLLALHAGIQMLALLLFTTAVGIGIYMAKQIGFGRLNSAHPYLGLVVFALLLTQPVTGYVHHVLWKREKGRTGWSYVHLWLGRVGITVGIVNGGLGLRLAGNSKRGEVAYAVVAAVVWVVWAGCAVYGEVKRKRSRATDESSRYERREGQRYGGEDGSDESMDPNREWYSKRETPGNRYG